MSSKETNSQQTSQRRCIQLSSAPIKLDFHNSIVQGASSAHTVAVQSGIQFGSFPPGFANGRFWRHLRRLHLFAHDVRLLDFLGGFHRSALHLPCLSRGSHPFGSDGCGRSTKKKTRINLNHKKISKQFHRRPVRETGGHTFHMTHFRFHSIGYQEVQP